MSVSVFTHSLVLYRIECTILCDQDPRQKRIIIFKLMDFLQVNLVLVQWQDLTPSLFHSGLQKSSLFLPPKQNWTPSLIPASKPSLRIPLSCRTRFPAVISLYKIWCTGVQVQWRVSCLPIGSQSAPQSQEGWPSTKVTLHAYKLTLKQSC